MSMRTATYASGDEHAAELVDDEHVERRRRLAEALLEDLQHVLDDGAVLLEGDGHVTERDDGVNGDERRLVVAHLGRVEPIGE